MGRSFPQPENHRLTQGSRRRQHNFSGHPAQNRDHLILRRGDFRGSTDIFAGLGRVFLLASATLFLLNISI
jgi:hypothetical protein